MNKRIVLALMFVLLISGAFSYVPPPTPFTAISELNIKTIKLGQRISFHEPVMLKEGEAFSTVGLADYCGVPRGTIKFCYEEKEPQCPAKVVFPAEYFSTSENQSIVKTDVCGSIWAYNRNGTYWIGFIASKNQLVCSLSNSQQTYSFLSSFLPIIILLPLVAIWYKLSKKPLEERKKQLNTIILIVVILEVIWLILLSFLLC
ncbi:MAG: hypothetical protein J7L23_04665 [Candidatus Diapherotrites archaeon]|nr:hypothetical protein [Candidatus Diapherotrites archaeon]